MEVNSPERPTLQCTAEGLFSSCDRRNMKTRRRNRVSEPDPSKEGPVSKETGLSVPPRQAFDLVC